MGINRLDNETHVYTEKSARFIYVCEPRNRPS
ncbi:hypothetical protein CsSME_00002746 [Camellia sinensis var. sinensis]